MNDTNFCGGYQILYLVHLVKDTELNIGKITSFLAYLLEHSQVNTVKNINKRAGLKMTKTIGCCSHITMYYVGTTSLAS